MFAQRFIDEVKLNLVTVRLVELVELDHLVDGWSREAAEQQHDRLFSLERREL
jgi:hypothetical protein